MNVLTAQKTALSAIMLILAWSVEMDSSLTKLQVNVLHAQTTVHIAQTVKLVRYVNKVLPLIQHHLNVLRVVMITCISTLQMEIAMTVWIIVTCVTMVKLATLVHLVTSILIMIPLMQISMLQSLTHLTISVSLLVAMLPNSLTMTSTSA